MREAARSSEIRADEPAPVAAGPLPRLDRDGRFEPDRDLGSARPQPQGRGSVAAQRGPHSRHRPLGIGQVEPRVRHDLRRGAATLRRVAVVVRAPVPGPDGEARRGLDRGPVAGDLDRPEDDLAQPALDGRHGDRDLRLPAPAVGAGRPPALPQVRRPDRGSVGGADHRPPDDPPGGRPVHGHGAGRAWAQGRVRKAARGHPRAGLRPGDDRRRAAAPRRGDRARQEVQARHLDRRRPSGDEAGPAKAARRVGGGGDGPRGGDGRDRARRVRQRRLAGRARRRRCGPGPRGIGPGRRGRRGGRAAPDLLGALRVPELRHLDAGARAEDLLLQLPPRLLRALSRARISASGRPRAGDPRPDAVDLRGRAQAVHERGVALPQAAFRGRRREPWDRRRHALAGPAEARSRRDPRGHRGRAPRRHVSQPSRASPLLHGALRGDPRRARASLPQHRLRQHPRADRVLHGASALPGVRGGEAAAREPRGEGRRPQHPRVHRALGPRRPRVDRVAGADRDRAHDRAPHRARDRRASALPRQRRDRVSVARARRHDALGRRGAAHPARDADRLEPGRGPLHPRRALDRPPPARQREADRDPRAAARPRQHGDRRRARRGHDPRRRPRRGPRAGRGRARRTGGLRGHAEADRGRLALAHGPVPVGQALYPGAGAAPRRERRDDRKGGAPAQPQEHRRRVPARRVHLRHRGLGVGQVHARQRDPLPRRRQPPSSRAPAPRRARSHRGRGRRRQDHQHRPVADRPHAALQPGDLHGRLRPHPPALLADA